MKYDAEPQTTINSYLKLQKYPLGLNPACNKTIQHKRKYRRFTFKEDEKSIYQNFLIDIKTH